MRSRYLPIAACAALFSLVVCGVVLNALAEPQEKANSSKVVSTKDLGGAQRYLTFISTDKPIYRPGETAYLRAVMLDQRTREPMPEGRQTNALIEIHGPKGDVVAQGWAPSQDSVIAFSWDVPPGQAGGEYTAVVTHPTRGYAPAERTFDIRSYRAPRLKSQIEFLRDGYGPGDVAAATLHVERAEGGAPAGAKVTVIARIDGQEVHRGETTVDEEGDCSVRFELPGDIRRGEGTLAMVIEDGGVLETAAKTIPILLQTVDLTMYPEGGDLVAGLPTRVYFEAFTPAKKPADLAGVVLDETGAEVATFRSEHEGRGRFGITPQAGKRYELSITNPSGIKTRYPLPEVKESGAVVSAEKDVFAPDQPVEASVSAAGEGDYTVTLRQRERLVDSQTIRASEQPQKVSLAAKDASGVLIVTVSDSKGNPLAERLVFRRSAKAVQVKITADQSQYVPGGKAKLTVQTTDAKGQPISAVVGLAVTDDSVLEMIEKREQAPRLPVMALLESEVQDLADAHVYLDDDNPDAPLAVDLLLGTQGWRRFALMETKKFLSQHGDDASRALAAKLVSPPVPASQQADFFGIGGAEGAPALEFRAENEKLAKGVEPVDRDAAEDAPAAASPPEEEAESPANDDLAPAGESRPAAVEEPRQDFADALDGARVARRRQRFLGQGRQDQAGLGDAGFAGGFSERAPNDFVAVRVYAHSVRPNRTPGERRDFTETLFWHAGLQTDENGKADLEFGLNDSVTSFRVIADAFTADGALGEASHVIESVEPFYLEPKLPLEVSSGDFVQAPIGIVNATGADLDARVNLSAHATQELDLSSWEVLLPPGARQRRLQGIRVGKFHGEAELTVSGAAGPYADKVIRTLLVKPRGFPAEKGFGGMLSPDGVVRHEFQIPRTLVSGSVRTRVTVHPTPLASMTEALKRLIREPYGCFEQTSSTTYPLVMAQQYFLSHEGVDPSLIEKSSQILETGYQRLLGFESPSGGFEWFGSDPGHDALTAYGLMEFTDMSQVRRVDSAMLERTKKWLLEQRDGKGGYQRKTHTLHTWIADPQCANTYNTWSLLETGAGQPLRAEVAWVRSAAEKMDNTYALALAANVLLLAEENDAANRALDALAGRQSEDGSLQGATTSVVGSGGEALVIETTSLALLAWLKNSRYIDNVERAMKFLAEHCKAGRFGSTQSTVLALKALVAYDDSRAKPKSPGALQLVVDGKAFGEPVNFTADSEGVIELPDFASALSPGRHVVEIQMQGGSQMPCSGAVDYYDVKPASSEDVQMHLATRLVDAKVAEGETTEALVAVVNRTGEPLPNPLAIVGIPGGLEVRHDQLKELVKRGQIAAYEVTGRDVVLYWRSLSPEQRVEVSLSLVAAVPGKYTGPASRAYLYYTDEHKHWNDPLSIEITP